MATTLTTSLIVGDAVRLSGSADDFRAIETISLSGRGRATITFEGGGTTTCDRGTTWDRAEATPVASLPLPTPGNVVATPEHDGVVTMTRADWDTIAAILRDMRVAGAVSGPQDEALAGMSFVECTLVGA